MNKDRGVFPTRNWQEGVFNEREKIDPYCWATRYVTKNKACFACTIACGRVTRLGDQADKYLVNMHPRNWRTAGEGPEYETAWALGADTGVGEDMDVGLKSVSRIV